MDSFTICKVCMSINKHCCPRHYESNEVRAEKLFKTLNDIKHVSTALLFNIKLLGFGQLAETNLPLDEDIIDRTGRMLKCTFKIKPAPFCNGL